MNIFVGNLLFEATEGDLKKAFEVFGNVAAVEVVMDKKGRKSRGFGFVQMPDERQAQEAITALDGKAFMGRVLNVSPALSKAEMEEDSEKRKISRLELENKVQKYSGEDKEQKDFRFNKPFDKTSKYKQGRRSRSFMTRLAASGIKEAAMPRKKSHENPMRWRKRSEFPKPWKSRKNPN